MLTNREIATFAILGVVVIWVVLSPKLRRSGAGVLRAFFQWKIQLIFVLYFGYVAFVVWVAALSGVWTWAILKDTIIWTFITGFPILFRVTNVKDGKLLVRRTVAETFAASAFIAFYINLYSFSIPWEIVLQIVVTFLVMLELVARHQGAAAKPVANFVGALLVGGGILLIWATGSWLVKNWDTLNHAELAMSLALGLWLPIALIPFIYFLAFFMHCESTLKMVRYFRTSRTRTQFDIGVAFFVGVRFSAKFAGRFTGQWRMKLSKAANFREASAIMAEYRESLRSEEI